MQSHLPFQFLDMSHSRIRSLCQRESPGGNTQGPVVFPCLVPLPQHRDVQTGQDGACAGGGDTPSSQEQLGSGSELMTPPRLSDALPTHSPLIEGVR